MPKVSVVVRVENEHGASEHVVLSAEGDDREKLEDSIVQEMFIGGSNALVDAFAEIEDPKPKKKPATRRKTAAKKPAGKK